jgi:glycosyltransferase involved in cell wall biosynthesis
MLDVFLVSYEFPPMIGGEGVYTHMLAEALTRMGNRVTVLTGSADSEMKPSVEGFDLVRLSIPKTGLRLFSFNRVVKKKIDEVTREGVIDVLHVTNDVMYISMPKDVVDLPRVATVHHPWAAERRFFQKNRGLFNFLGYAWGKKIYYLEWLEKKISLESDRLIAVSNFTANSIMDEYKVPSERVKVIPNAVDVERFNPRVGGAGALEKLGVKKGSVVLYVGKLDYHKGVEYLIKGFVKVLDAHSDARLVLAGDGPMRRRLERLVKGLEIGGSVVFAGRVPDKELPGFYSASDVVVLPSLMEGFGIVVLHGETGLVTPPADPDSLSGAILRLLSDTGLSRRFGKAGRKRVVENFTPRRVADQTVDLYKKLL